MIVQSSMEQEENEKLFEDFPSVQNSAEFLWKLFRQDKEVKNCGIGKADGNLIFSDRITGLTGIWFTTKLTKDTKKKMLATENTEFTEIFVLRRCDKRTCKKSKQPLCEVNFSRGCV